MSFKPAPLPENERNRLLAVEKTGVLDIVDEALYNIYSGLARKITNCPQSWANVMDKDRQYNFVLEGEGVSESEKEGYRENPRNKSFCQYALMNTDPLIVNDLKKSTIFKEHESVKKQDGPRFYAAFPLINAEGYILGSLCVQDKRVRRLSRETINLMKSLASKLSHQLDIQAKQRSTTAESVLQAMSVIRSEFNGIKLDEAISVVRYFAGTPISDDERNLLIKFEIIDEDLRLNKASRVLKKALNLDAGILRRMKLPSGKTEELNNLFKALG